MKIYKSVLLVKCITRSLSLAKGILLPQCATFRTWAETAIRHLSPTVFAALFFCCLLTLAIGPGLRADVTGSILGVATDSSAAILQHVTVVATNLENNSIHKTLTDASGQYHLLALPVGKCKASRNFSRSESN